MPEVRRTAMELSLVYGVSGVSLPLDYAEAAERHRSLGGPDDPVVIGVADRQVINKRVWLDAATVSLEGSGM